MKMVMEREDKELYMNITANQCPGCPENLAAKMAMQVVFEELGNDGAVFYGQGCGIGRDVLQRTGLGTHDSGCAAPKTAMAIRGLDRPLVIGQMLGEVNSNEVIRSSGLLPGDALLLTKGLAIEATSIVAREMPDTLRGKGWSDRDLAEAANYLTQPGISVVEDARIAQAAGEIHALHDPTEGGVATALVEIATASGVDLDIDADTLPISPVSQRLCDDVGIDPFGAISSGALLIGCTAGTTRTIVDALATRGIVAAQIGTVRSGRVEGRSSEVRLRRDDSWEALPQFSVDEIARLFTETS